MRKIATYAVLVVVLGFVAVQIGCGDGRHGVQPMWTTTAPDLSEVAAKSMECVDVTNYKKIEYTGTSEVDTGDLIPSDITTESSSESSSDSSSGINLKKYKPSYILNTNVPKPEDTPSAVETNTQLMEVVKEQAGVETEASDSQTSDAAKTKEIRKCIKTEIEGLKKCGPSCETYLGGFRWLLTREKLSKKPKESEVNIIKFVSCEQIKEADCLLVN